MIRVYLTLSSAAAFLLSIFCLVPFVLFGAIFPSEHCGSFAARFACREEPFEVGRYQFWIGFEISNLLNLQKHSNFFCQKICVD